MSNQSANTVKLGVVTDVFARGKSCVQPACIGENAADTTGILRIFRHVKPVNRGAAAINFHQRTNHTNGRRLTGTVRSEQSGDLSIRCGKADAIDCRDLAKVLR